MGDPPLLRITAMKRIVISTACLFATATGWAGSMPEAQPANGWLLALMASAVAFMHSLNRLEVQA